MSIVWKQTKKLRRHGRVTKEKLLRKNVVERQYVSNIRIKNNFNKEETMNITLWYLGIVRQYLKVNNMRFELSFNKL